MSVIVIGRLSVDPANVARLWVDRRADFEDIAQRARAAGATHHRWGFGDDYVVLIDEWPDAASFQNFFGTEAAIADLMQAAGMQGPPDFAILEAREGPDHF